MLYRQKIPFGHELLQGTLSNSNPSQNTHELSDQFVIPNIQAKNYIHLVL